MRNPVERADEQSRLWASSFADARQGALRSYLRIIHPLGAAAALLLMAVFVGLTPMLLFIVAALLFPMIPVMYYVPEHRLVVALGTLDIALVTFFGLAFPEMWPILAVAAFSIVSLGWAEGPWHSGYLGVLAVSAIGVITLFAGVDYWPVVTAGAAFEVAAVSVTALWATSARTVGLKQMSESLDSMSVVMWEADDDGVVTDIAGRVEEMFGMTPTEAIGRHVSDGFDDPGDLDRWRAAATERVEGESISFVHGLVSGDGRAARTTVRASGVAGERRWRGVTTDISDQWATGGQQRRLASIVDHMSDGLLLIDVRSSTPSIVRINERGRQLLDASADVSLFELTARFPNVEPIVRDALEAQEERLVAIETGTGLRWLGVQCYAVDGDMIAIQFADATDRKFAQDQAEHEARTDQLTGIPNRSELERKLADRLGTERNTTVFLLDLDRFKPVNDQYGHRTGDVVLRTIARRVAGTLKDGDIVGRLGGDEFGGLISGHLTAEEQVRIRQRLVNACSDPIDVEGALVSVGASVGFAESDDGATVEDLLDAADQAMYLEKAMRSGDQQRSVVETSE